MRIPMLTEICAPRRYFRPIFTRFSISPQNASMSSSFSVGNPTIVYSLILLNPEENACSAA